MHLDFIVADVIWSAGAAGSPAGTAGCQGCEESAEDRII